MKMELIKRIVILFLFFNSFIMSKTLLEVQDINKLSNYNEIKKRNTNQIYEDSSEVKRRNDGLLYLKNENQPFTGVQIYRKDGINIYALYFYKNGRVNGESYVYYKSGRLQKRLFFYDDIKTNLIGYYENGIKSAEVELLKDPNVRNQNIFDGKSLLYDKKGNLFAEMQFKNDSTVGLKQKFYENNRLKYEFIAGGEWNEPAKPSQYYIEYYDNSDKVAMHCEEKSNGSWTCKEYKKDGTFKREKEYPTVIYKQRGTKDWINYLLPVLKVFGL